MAEPTVTTSDRRPENPAEQARRSITFADVESGVWPHGEAPPGGWRFGPKQPAQNGLAPGIAELPTRQQRALLHLMSGESITTAGKLSGVDRRTIYRWLKEPVFGGKLAEAKAEAAGAIESTIPLMAEEAVATIHDKIKQGDGWLALQFLRETGMLAVIRAENERAAAAQPAPGSGPIFGGTPPPLQKPSAENLDLTPSVRGNGEEHGKNGHAANGAERSERGTRNAERGAVKDGARPFHTTGRLLLLVLFLVPLVGACSALRDLGECAKATHVAPQSEVDDPSVSSTLRLFDTSTLRPAGPQRVLRVEARAIRRIAAGGLLDGDARHSAFRSRFSAFPSPDLRPLTPDPSITCDIL